MAAPALARLNRRFAIGGKLVQVGLQAGAAIAAGLVRGAEFLEIVAARASQAAMLTAFFRTTCMIRTAHDLARVRLAGENGQADQAGEKNGGFSHGLARTF
jgi:hypothetical protein